MRIKSEEKKEMRPERDKKITLNIPVEGKSEISRKEIYSGNSLSNYDADILDIEKKTQDICLSDSDDDSSSTEDEEQMTKVPEGLNQKGPINPTKDENKKLIKNYTSPYILHYSTRSEALQSGGDVKTLPINNYISLSNDFQIPQTVAEFETPAYNVVPDDLNKFYHSLNENQRRLLDKAVDTATLDFDGSKRKQIFHPNDLDACNSPDSSYGTMSPASVPPPVSPYSLHSPNPPIEKSRLSESDSMMSDNELGSSELQFGPLDILKAPIVKTSPTCRGPTTSQTTSINYNLLPVVPLPVIPQKFLRSIQPDSEIVVNEIGIMEPAEVRLRKQNLMRDKIQGDQWTSIVKAYDLLNPGFDAEEKKKLRNRLRKELIDLITGPRQPNFYEKLYSILKYHSRNSPSDFFTEKDTKSGHTPLTAAALLRYDTPIIARLIIDFMGKTVGKLDDEDNTLLHYLAKEGDSHAQVMSELLHSNLLDVNAKNVGCKTALHQAIECHNPPTKSCIACVDQLVKNGANLLLKDFAGKTALHLAVETGDPQLLRKLLNSSKAGSVINSVDNNNDTPLHLAARRNDLNLSVQIDLIKRLVLSGARYNIRNNQQRTAFLLVSEPRRKEIRNILP